MRPKTTLTGALGDCGGVDSFIGHGLRGSGAPPRSHRRQSTSARRSRWPSKRGSPCRTEAIFGSPRRSAPNSSPLTTGLPARTRTYEAAHKAGDRHPPLSCGETARRNPGGLFDERAQFALQRAVIGLRPLAEPLDLLLRPALDRKVHRSARFWSGTGACLERRDNLDFERHRAAPQPPEGAVACRQASGDPARASSSISRATSRRASK